MDSTIGMRLLVAKYKASNVHAISFNYGQKQSIELERATQSTTLLGVTHQILPLDAVNILSQGHSANIDKNINMPTIQDILGDPKPPTEVPNRNMIMLSIAAAYCQTRQIDTLICGIQGTDQYSYWDCTEDFINAINCVLNLNRITRVKVIAPFVELSKTDELLLLKELDDNFDLLKYTLTCYNPQNGLSCGKCPSCSERLRAFYNINERDVIPYI